MIIENQFEIVGVMTTITYFEESYFYRSWQI